MAVLVYSRFLSEFGVNAPPPPTPPIWNEWVVQGTLLAEEKKANEKKTCYKLKQQWECANPSVDSSKDIVLYRNITIAGRDTGERIMLG